MKIPQDMIEGTIHTTNSCGDLVVVEYINCKNVKIKFVDTEFAATSHSCQIRDGRVKDALKPSVFSVGFIGVGEYAPSVNGIHTKQYSSWHNMLKRCYHKKTQETQPTYIGCSVCDEWHNFQVFAKWFDVNYVNGLHLDKDIKVKGNKIYSPDYCSFVTLSENNINSHAKSYVFLNPKSELVEIYNLKEFCIKNKLTRNYMSLLYRGKLSSYRGWTLPS